MSKINIECEECGVRFDKCKSELKRSKRIGRRSFCSLKCSGTAVNRDKKAKTVILKCPVCSKDFKTSKKKKARRHCSRVCASKNSVTERRRAAAKVSGLRNMNKGNLLTIEELLKKREAWKYEPLKEALSDEPHEFECRIGDRIFDLVLTKKMIVVEFDGPDHLDAKQTLIDAKKDRLAASHGYRVVRRQVGRSCVIPPETLNGVL